MAKAITHEAFIAKVAALACSRLDEEERCKCDGIKLVYGAGAPGLRGVTYYNRWKGQGQEQARPFVEVCAFGQEHWVQVAGTTIHELGHVLAGWEAGHGPAWKEACRKLGLRAVKAAGTEYHLANLAPDIRLALASGGKPDEGEPVSPLGTLLGPRGGKPRSCGAGQGTRGGKSRGKGSGSRLRLWGCGCDDMKVRGAASAPLARLACDQCGTHLSLRD